MTIFFTGTSFIREYILFFFCIFVISILAHLWAQLKVLNNKLTNIKNETLLPDEILYREDKTEPINAPTDTTATDFLRVKDEARGPVITKLTISEKDMLQMSSVRSDLAVTDYFKFAETVKVDMNTIETDLSGAERAGASARNRGVRMARKRLVKVLLLEKKRKIDLEMQRKLSDCAQLHQTLLRFKEEAEKLLNHASILFLFGYLLSFSCILVELKRADINYVEVMYYFLILPEYIILLLTMCWVSELINTEFLAVKDNVYECDWIGSSEGFKRSMRIMMSFANQDNYFTAAGFVPFSMETFSSMTKTAYSYYKVFVTFNNK